MLITCVRFRIGLFALALFLLPSLNCVASTLLEFAYAGFSIGVCKVDLRTDKLQMFWRDEQKVVFGSFDALQTWLKARGQSLICATNAGIYGKDLRPLGLYIENGVELRKLNVRKNAYGNFYMQPNGLYLVREHDAAIVSTDRFAAERGDVWRDILFATQSGPLLIERGQVNPVFSPTSDNRLVRNAICTLSPYESALVLSRGPITFYDFAYFLKDTLHCTDALYLDGNISRLYPGGESDLDPSLGVIIGVIKQR